jgi:hypothetical protein
MSLVLSLGLLLATAETAAAINSDLRYRRSKQYVVTPRESISFISSYVGSLEYDYKGSTLMQRQQVLNEVEARMDRTAEVLIGGCFSV